MKRKSNLLTLALLMPVLLSVSCGEKKETQTKPEAIKVALFTISEQSSKQQLKYSGSIEPDNTAQIGFAVPGIVNNILVQEGQKVHQGQLLASIDATEYINALSIANAGLEQAEDMFTRLDGLYKKGSLPEKDYIDVKTKLAQARANRNINQKRIADSKLYAPISGVISKKAIERGSTAAPGVPAFTVLKTDRVFANISVPESEVGAIKNGMTVSVYVPTLQDTLLGNVSIVNPQADAVSKTFTVKVLLNNSDGRLLPGMIIDARITTNKQLTRIAVPAQAIVRDADGLTYVFLENLAKKATKRRITSGNLVGENLVIVETGLKVGDKVVTAGQTRLKDGSSISY